MSQYLSTLGYSGKEPNLIAYYIWLVGCSWFNGPLRQYFSLYRAISQREGEREKTEESKNVQTTPTRTYCKRNRPLPYYIQIVGRPGTGSLPRTIAPPDHPRLLIINKAVACLIQVDSHWKYNFEIWKFGLFKHVLAKLRWHLRLHVGQCCR